MEDSDIDAFVLWFQSSGGYIDVKAMGITEFPDSGRGAIALTDIPEGHTLFTLPRSLTLSTRTSPLPSRFGLDAWRAHGLHKGWVGLILCMMWEDAWAHELSERDQENVQTGWAPYMRTLPTTFDTPMFWSPQELEELKGTAVVDKIGRDDAERAYASQLVPAIKKSPTLFPPSHYEKWYTLDAYHRAGSRILSRSFTVSRWASGDELEETDNNDSACKRFDADDDEIPQPDASNNSSMRTNSPSSFFEDAGEGVDSDSNDDEADDPSDVALVPMADALNARWGSENAKLFYEPFQLRMVTTKNIKEGEQIFNTYGDPPNSDLLRRYGHVDMVQLPGSFSSLLDEHGDIEMKSDQDVETVSHLGNPPDIVEIRADLVVRVVVRAKAQVEQDMEERIEWWLDEGGDDTFILDWPEASSHNSTILPPALVSLTRLLMLSESEFSSMRTKGKFPKGKLRKSEIKDNKEVLEILDEVLKQREGMYIGGSVEDDERLLGVTDALIKRKRHAVIVRLGEKRILRAVRQVLRVMLVEPNNPSGAGCGNETHDTRSEKRGGNGIREERSGEKRAINGVDGNRGKKKARK